MTTREDNYQYIGLIVTLSFLMLICSGLPTYAMKSLSEKEMGSVTAKEGMLIDIALDVTVGNAEFIDADGESTCCSGSQGEIQVGGNTGMHLHESTGGAADLTGLTVDFDGSTNVGSQIGVGAIVLGMPNGNFDVTNDANNGEGVNIFPGERFSDGGSSAGGFRLENVDVSGTRIEVSTNPP